MADMTGFEMPEPELHEAVTSGDLADRLVQFVVDRMEEFSSSTAPGLELPGIFAGHPVLDDAAADLIYVLGLLVDQGVEELAGVPLASHLRGLIGALDPARVEGFFSYRVGETALRLGGLDALGPELGEHVLAAVDTPEVRQRLEEGSDAIPPNFAVVAARCLATEARLRGAATDARLDTYLDRVRSMFAEAAPAGWIDDGMGSWVHYDIYTPDVYLFAQPFADRLGDHWVSGLTNVLGDLDELCHPGGAVTWGRSIGALGLAITIELAAVAVGHHLGTEESQSRWLARAIETLDDFGAWFPDGVVAAHQHRATMFYRGTPRRLQLTLDLYGKLLLAAADLRARPTVRAASPAGNWANADRIFRFATSEDPDQEPDQAQDQDRDQAQDRADTGGGLAGLWSHRSSELSFVLPMLFGFSSDYGPCVRGPGLFEQPTSGHPTMVPTVSPLGHDEGAGASPKPLAPAALPREVDAVAGSGLRVRHDGWAELGTAADHPRAVGGSREATYEVLGRSLVVDESLRFDAALPGPLSITVPETPDRPLRVEAEATGDTGHRIRQTSIDTSGLTEWRSFWGEISRVHQIEVLPGHAEAEAEADSFEGGSIDLRWKVTPQLRVASTIAGHPYDNALYRPLAGRVVNRSVGLPDAGLARRLRDVDVLHMAWPEWWAGTDPARNAAAIDIVKATGTKIVWTQHNLLPHFFKTDDAAATYALWAQAADAVIHHSVSGQAVARSTYAYSADTDTNTNTNTNTVHSVIPHGHWGSEFRHFAKAERAKVEAEEGWPQAAIRVAVIGSPRAEKNLQLVVDAVAACDRADIQLVIRVDDDTVVPDDPRIIAEQGHTDTDRYERRLAAIDAIVLPFASEGMLTTGTAFDAIGAGVPAITSDWAFFDDTFDGADIRYGTTREDLTRCLDELTPARLRESGEATLARQASHDWSDIATATLELFEGLW